MKALLVIDIQERFMKESPAYEEERFISVVNKAIKFFRKNEDLIVYVHHLEGGVKPNTAGWGFDPRILKNESDPCVWKTKGSAFDGTDLRKILDKHKIDEITICGLVTQNCIRSSAIGSIEEGFKTNLIKKGTTNWAENPQETIDRVEAELEGLGLKLVELK
ncbi:MAG: isochorismatase family cysteine hydrolase [Candidatus Neomarinimicrobiota bacterium]